MSSPVIVRSARPRELKYLLEMCDALNALSGLPTGRLDSANFADALFGDRAFLFADIAHARREGARVRSPIGYVLSHDAFTTDFGERGMYVVDVFVDAEWRRQGVGRQLFKAAATRARTRGATHLWWASMPWNEGARRFYAELGASDEKLHSHTLADAALDRLLEG